MPRDVEAFPEVQPALDEDGKVLLLAADLLEQYGWCQHVLTDTDGRHCALGAVDAAASLLRNDKHAPTRRLRNHLGQPRYSWFSIADWNNAPERTVHDVTSALRSAAHAVPS